MKRFSRLIPIALTGLAGLASVALADEPSSSAPMHRRNGRLGLRGIERCLADAGLSSDQQASVRSILSDARTALQADVQALRADHQRLRADLDNGADKSVLGQDVLTQKADREKLQSDMQAVRAQVAAKLTTEQQGAFDACSTSQRAAGKDSADAQEPPPGD